MSFHDGTITVPADFTPPCDPILLDNLPHILWTVRPDGRLDFCNRRWLDYTGIPFDQAQGVDWEAVVYPNDLQAYFDRWNEALHTGEDLDVELRLKRGSDGQYRWHLCRALAQRNERSEIIRWVGTCTDIHEQKQSVQDLQKVHSKLQWQIRERTEDLVRINDLLLAEITERQRAEETLQESQHFIQSIAEASPNIVYLYDVIEQRNVYCSREIGALLGYTLDQIRSRGADLLSDLIHPDDQARVAEHHQKFAAVRKDALLDIEYRMKHADGRWRWLHQRDTVFTRTVQGQPHQILGTVQDITQRKWYEQKIEEQVARANEVNVQLELQKMELAEANAKLEALATTDGLTGLKNHRTFQECLEQEFQRARRYGSSLSVVLLDVDRFKQYNDAFGHPVGDTVLKAVARMLENTVRQTDLPARYGGEEF